MAGHPIIFQARPKPFIKLSLVLVLLILSPAINAQESKTSQVRPFQLHAIIEELPQLQRNKHSINSPGNLAIPSQAGSSQIASLSVPELSLRQPQVHSAPSLDYSQPSHPNLQANPDTASMSPGFVKEYNVNWSSWISMLADRWFFALRGMEEHSGTQIFTPRAALIQFTCYANGQIGNIYLRQSCGVPFYDQMQVQALLAVTPLPAFPTGSKRTSMTLIQGWDAHPMARAGDDYKPGSSALWCPAEKVRIRN